MKNRNAFTSKHNVVLVIINMKCVRGMSCTKVHNV